MALHRGIQSAIFFYLSCTPCAEERVRKKRKQQAERDRIDRAALEAHMPGLYQHPEPSATNPYWQAEIEAGPIPSRTRKKIADSTKGIASSTKSNIASSVSVNAVDGKMERSDSAKSGLGPHQREDEILWGAAIPEDGPSDDLASRLPMRPPRAMLNDITSKSYTHTANAAINDLHPPTTRKVQSKEEIAWMMQPPPVPEVMSGKVSAAVTRHGSSASRPSTTSTARTSRQSSTRGKQSTKPKDDETRPATLDGARPSNAFLTIPEGHSPVTRSRTLPGRHNRNESLTGIRKPPQASQAGVGEQRNVRPHLNTIISDSLVTQNNDHGQPDDQYTQNYNAARRKSSTAIPQRSPNVATTPKWLDSDEYDADSSANLDDWNSPGFELPQWIHEHTKREVRERWSFDI